MAAKKKGLGRGLNALIQPRDDSPSPEDPAPAPQSGHRGSRRPPSAAKRPSPPAAEPQAHTDAQDTPRELPVQLITANPYQPREHFEERDLDELAASIRELGVLSPLLVRPRDGQGGGYQLVAGERRFRAAQRAGFKNVPVIIRNLTDQEALEMALVENLQRRDLNLIEEAEGYQRLADEFQLTQEAIAKRVGKGRATVANALRLLSLAPEVRSMVADGRLSSGHAKALMALDIEEEQLHLAREALRERWSVRETERQVKRRLHPPAPTPPRGGKADIPADHIQFLTDKLHQRFGTGIRLVPTESLANGKKKRGRLEIDFYSNDDLDRLLELLGVAEDL